MNCLGADVARGSARWTIVDLAAGSAWVTVAGEATDGAQQGAPREIATAFLDVARAIGSGRLGDLAPRIRRPARALSELVPQVAAVRFETAVDDVVITGVTHGGVQFSADPPPTPRAHGAVRGRVETLLSRGGLRFTLYEAFHGVGVSCYLAAGQEDVMRDVWGRVALVEGVITRDDDGRPRTVRQITAVEVLPEVDPDAWLTAQGAVSPADGAPSPEAVIRALRDSD